MTSQSLYRKWRSQTFGELVGQEPVIRTLKNALNSGNLAHAYLFTGPRGTGKTSTARLLAKTINCSQPKNGEPCNVCEQCREITAGNSFNVAEIDAASNRGIDSIRELREKVMMPPTTGKYKVYILDEAHMLTVEAFNALLKTLEEPPPHTIFVMATTDVHKMLPTVLSRCQRFDFKRITTRQIVDHLRFVATQEDVTLESGAAELIARAASGGMRDALSLLDQATAYAGSVIALKQVQAMLGVADPHAIQKFISSVADLDSPVGLHLIHELAEAGADLRQINSQVAEYWRAMMLTRAGANIGEILDHTNDETREIIHLSQFFALEELTECAKIFAQNELVQKNQGTPQLGLELALLSCIELHRSEKSSQTVAASANGSERMSTPSSASHSVQRSAYNNQHRLSASDTLVAPTSLHTSVRQAQNSVTPATLPSTPASASPPISQPSTHDAPDIYVSEQQPIEQPAASEPLETERAANDLPDWDSMPHFDEDETPDQKATTQPEPSVQAASSKTPVNPVASVPSQPDDNDAVHGPDVAAEIKAEEAVTHPSLILQEVKEKWEYIKRRVKSKKDGAMIAALLNGYTVVGIEQDAGMPVVAIRANAAFHYSALQKQTHHETVEWALKLELKQDCKVHILPPGQGSGSGATIPPPPSPPPVINSMASRATLTPQATPPHRSTHKKQPTPAAKSAGASPTPIKTQAQKAQAIPPVPPAKEELPAQSYQAGPASSIASVQKISSQSSSLARMTDEKENTIVVPATTGESRLIFAQKKAKNDQVVQEVVRLFKADMKDIQLK